PLGAGGSAPAPGVDQHCRWHRAVPDRREDDLPDRRRAVRRDSRWRAADRADGGTADRRSVDDGGAVAAREPEPRAHRRLEPRADPRMGRYRGHPVLGDLALPPAWRARLERAGTPDG